MGHRRERVQERERGIEFCTQAPKLPLAALGSRFDGAPPCEKMAAARAYGFDVDDVVVGPVVVASGVSV